VHEYSRISRQRRPTTRTNCSDIKVERHYAATSLPAPDAAEAASNARKSSKIEAESTPPTAESAPPAAVEQPSGDDFILRPTKPKKLVLSDIHRSPRSRRQRIWDRIKGIWQYISDNKILSTVMGSLLLTAITGITGVAVKACTADQAPNSPPPVTSTPASTTPRSKRVSPSAGVPAPPPGERPLCCLA
jgi:hypothetical protein